MKEVFLFILYSILAVFGFIAINLCLFDFFYSDMGISESTSKDLLVCGWGAVVLIDIFYFGIIKDFKS